MRTFILPVFLCLHLCTSAQYPIGTRQLSLVDASRNRTIAATAYYPSASAGTDVPLADGEFPVLVMGHGFVMGIAA